MKYKKMMLIVAVLMTFVASAQASLSVASTGQSIVIKGDIYNRGNSAVNTDTTDSGLVETIAPKQFSPLFSVTLSP
ncbi:hypothetical protein ABTL20_20945, partial [Acinetobacter baumannii]